MKHCSQEYAGNLMLRAWIALVLIVPNAAWAGGNPFEDSADGVFDFLTGGIATSLMGIAVIAVAAGVMMGKLAWSTLGALFFLILVVFSIEWILGVIEKAAS